MRDSTRPPRDASAPPARRGPRRGAALLLLACLATVIAVPGPRARADDAKRVPPELAAARDLIAALEAKDDASVAAVTAREGLDPWSVADRMVGLGEADAAEAWARTLAHGDALAAYVAGCKGKPSDDDLRSVLDDVEAYLADGKPDTALTLATAARPASGSVQAVRAEALTGLALDSLHRVVEAGDAYERAARVARALGWLDAADVNWDRAARAAYRGYRYAVARARWEARLEVVRALPVRAPIAALLNNLASACGSAGDLQASRSRFREAVERFLEEEDPLQAATALTNLAVV